MIDVRSFRFVIPPVIIFFIIFLGMAIDPACNFNTIRSKLPEPLQRFDGFAVPFIGIVILSFAFGFVITTISTFFIRVAYWFRSHWKFCIFNGLWNGPAVNWEWDKEARKKLEDIFQLDKWRHDGEFCEHAILSKVPEPLRLHVQRKWEFFQTDINSLVAIGLANMLFPYLEIKTIWYYWLIVSIFAVLLVMNGYTSYKDAMKMDHFLLRNINSLSKIKGMEGV